jgi:orotate phosphoribosyltransferase
MSAEENNKRLYGSSHYSNNMTPKKLAESGKAGGKAIMAWAAHREITPVLVYTGMSGIGVATAISLWLNRYHPDFKFYMIYVRKENEQCHGRPTENNFPLDATVPNMIGVFVDDCISGGTTRIRCMNAAKSRHGVLVGAHFLTNDSLFDDKCNKLTVYKD